MAGQRGYSIRAILQKLSCLSSMMPRIGLIVGHKGIAEGDIIRGMQQCTDLEP